MDTRRAFLSIKCDALMDCYARFYFINAFSSVFFHRPGNNTEKRFHLQLLGGLPPRPFTTFYTPITLILCWLLSGRAVVTGFIHFSPPVSTCLCCYHVEVSAFLLLASTSIEFSYPRSLVFGSGGKHLTYCLGFQRTHICVGMYCAVWSRTDNPVGHDSQCHLDSWCAVGVVAREDSVLDFLW